MKYALAVLFIASRAHVELLLQSFFQAAEYVTGPARQVLDFLSHFLALVAQNAQVNKMTAHNSCTLHATAARLLHVLTCFGSQLLL